ncbi:hypothetical protein BFD50_26475 [Escherichia coli]|nr:hypothetical protein BFD50_26475 [Escherichia coli]
MWRISRRFSWAVTTSYRVAETGDTGAGGGGRLSALNARRREMGQKPLTTAQIVDEICDFVANQQAVFLGGHYILQGSRNR